MRRLARLLRTVADRIDHEAPQPEPECDLYDEESLSATEYALVSMRLLGIESRLADLEDMAGLTPGALSSPSLPLG